MPTATPVSSLPPSRRFPSLAPRASHNAQADPNNIDLHEGLAALCVDSGRPEEAAACYRRCLELHAAQTTAPAAAPANPAAQAPAPAPAAPANPTISSFPDLPAADLTSEEEVPGSQAAVPATDAAAAEATQATAEAATEAAAARTDRWSVALFKCNASLCQWADWDIEALALRTAVRRQRRWRRQQRRQRREPSGERTGVDSTGGRYAVEGGRELGPAGPAPLSSRTVGKGSDDLVKLLLLGRDDDDGGGGGGGSWPSQDAKEDQSSDGDAVADVCVSYGLPRPALHPFDSLSAPLSIGDCLDVAQHQSRGLLAEAREECGNHRGGIADQELERNQRGEGQNWPRERRAASPSPPSSPRDATGRVRLGYVSGDLMGTHPLTHLMQARKDKPT